MMLRRFLIWIMLFALPLQGVAAATMLNCGPAHHAQMSALHAFAQEPADVHAHDVAIGEHEHHASHAGHQQHHHTDAVSDDGAQASTSDAFDHSGRLDAKCTACCVCSSGAMATASAPPTMESNQGSSAIVPLDLGTLPSVFLEGPRRPPRSRLA